MEKLDKIAADTPVPHINNVIETMKALNGNLNIQSQMIVNIAKIDESVTLKSEEKIKLIEQKEQATDLQKNDNLINLDAIKKEESELAADGDVVNARAAERHEQLRKTLEKHKLEQRQMMQEQKEILKDIKEQKQEFEREKQRMAKDDILKKNEKEMEIKVKEEVLSENRNNLKDIKKAEENNEINLEKNDKKILEKEEQNVADIKLNEKQKLDEINDVNIAMKTSEKKSNSFQEVLHNDNVKELQKISKNAASEAPSIEKTIVDRQIEFAELPLKKENQDKAKIEIIESNNSKNMKGPILNVLSKGILQRSIAEEGLLKESNNHQMKEKKKVLMNEVINGSDKAKFDDRFSVPVALKMMNQSKLEAVFSSLNKSESEIPAIQKDILTNEREKRDIDAVMNTSDTKVNSDHPLEKSEFLVKNINNPDPETCSKEKSAKKSKIEKQSEKPIAKLSTTEIPLIKTNVYLSDQGITKTFSIDVHVVSKMEHVNVKQRDLKALNHKDNIEI
jgi:hypothetical protein